jgi:hypothetical protein
MHYGNNVRTAEPLGLTCHPLTIFEPVIPALVFNVAVVSKLLPMIRTTV